ncbi:stomatal closure-related actin-binding protein 1-like isoform X1 [Iris pallida]|uniref:Stomatal closure-related actin-binding protein 1-like isoform X1 n=1 Tax=Iris pallida TaxID=29817 RepID=A0AAX6IHE2_IRIPA|nr:stomatal closure-related actin-binding protein 1-like isoform X1 [Iris pallida]
MTRATRAFRDTIQREAFRSVSSNVQFLTARFPKYMSGANNMVFKPEDHFELPSLKEIAAKEAALLLEQQQQQRLSVRDLAKKFDKGLATAAKLSNEAKWKEVASLDKHDILKKLRDVLEAFRGRVVGRTRDEVDEAISMVEAIAVQLTQGEGELFIEKEEVKKLANILKKASEDAKKVVEEERAYAHGEIQSAKQAVQRFEQALRKQEERSRSTKKQDREELNREAHEARRIKMLHQPSRVVDMEHELKALRTRLEEKSHHSIQLRKELEMNKRLEESKSILYELEGLESLGSCLRIVPQMHGAPEISSCSIQWYRVQPEGSKKDLISGATKLIYAPEPLDVGRFLQADIIFGDKRATVTTTGPIDPAAGLGSYVEALLRKAETEFNVVVVQMNGEDYPSNSIHVFHVHKLRLKLSKGKIAKAKEFYSTSMLLCGVRGAGNAAAQALFWQANEDLSFTLSFESERERNAAIMLARRFAFDCNIKLAGPGEPAPIGT